MSNSAGHKKKRICLFGGTFDPIHLGHSHIVHAAIREHNLDELIFLPCRQSPHKSGQKHASGEHRLKMCQIASEQIQSTTVDDFDLTAKEPCYSWRTVEHMQKRFLGASLFWLMGTDQWQSLPHWNRPEYLASLVEFIVFTRGDEPQPRKGYRMHSIQGAHPASATAIRKALKDGNNTQIQTWVLPEILHYIGKHQLYQATDDTSLSHKAGS